MFSHLQIYDPRERLAVGLLDGVLAAASAMGRVFRLDGLGLPRRTLVSPPKRVLLLRLERIGDLLMTLEAIAAVRALAPAAEIDLVVGSWNEGLARLIPGITHVRTLDAPWLAREGAGLQLRSLVGRATAEWAPRDYDVALNFEGDFRSHYLMRRSRAPVRVGFDHAGGGPLLTRRVRFDPTLHTAVNALRLVAAAAPELSGVPEATCDTRPSMRPALVVPETRHAAVRERLRALGVDDDTRLLGLHAAGGRAIKQWPPERFGEAVGALAKRAGVPVLLTGGAGERDLVERARRSLAPDVRAIDLVGEADLVTLAAWLARCTIYVTGDTGPMHLAAAVGTPVVGVFGPSTPARYAPLVQRRRIVEIHETLPCAPCNQIRLPPERCRGIVPDCLSGLGTDLVRSAAFSLWDEVTSDAGARR